MNEEERRIKEAKTVKGCLDWHKYCDAECCKYFVVFANKFRIMGNYIVIKTDLNISMQWYYKLHKIRVNHGRELIINTKDCVFKEKAILVNKACRLLKDNRCKGHPDMKPFCCRYLNERNLNDLGNIYLTENCKYRYLLLGGLKNEKAE